tara:strand:+ start:119 stop:379 length:261 start_codon:yes stop_codon:yes gene_type:complete
MSKLIILFLVKTIKLYKFIISPLFVNRCRYLPTCSEYFIGSLKIHGIIKGCYYGFKRILSCHPIKILGGGSGIDLVPKKNDLKEKT